MVHVKPKLGEVGGVLSLSTEISIKINLGMRKRVTFFSGFGRGRMWEGGKKFGVGGYEEEGGKGRTEEGRGGESNS